VLLEKKGWGEEGIIIPVEYYCLCSRAWTTCYNRCGRVYGRSLGWGAAGTGGEEKEGIGKGLGWGRKGRKGEQEDEGKRLREGGGPWGGGAERKKGGRTELRRTGSRRGGKKEWAGLA